MTKSILETISKYHWGGKTAGDIDSVRELLASFPSEITAKFFVNPPARLPRSWQYTQYLITLKVPTDLELPEQEHIDLVKREFDIAYFRELDPVEMACREGNPDLAVITEIWIKSRAEDFSVVEHIKNNFDIELTKKFFINPPYRICNQWLAIEDDERTKIEKRHRMLKIYPKGFLYSELKRIASDVYFLNLTEAEKACRKGLTNL